MINIIVASHRRSGTHYTIDTIYNNFNLFSTFDGKPYINLDANVEIDKNLKGSFIFKTHSTSDIFSFLSLKSPNNISFIENLLQNSKVVYVYRDGKDVLVSLYNYQKKFDKSLSNVSFSEFIRQMNTYEKHIVGGSLSRVAFLAHHVKCWKEMNDVLFVNFDEIKNDLKKLISKFELFFGERCNENLIDVSMGKSNADEKFKDEMIRSAISFNKGTSGEWVKYFNDEDLIFYEKEYQIS